MNADLLPGLAAILGALILVGSSLWRSRLGSAKSARLALLWVGIIALTWGAVSLAPSTPTHILHNIYYRD